MKSLISYNGPALFYALIFAFQELFGFIYENFDFIQVSSMISLVS